MGFQKKTIKQSVNNDPFKQVSTLDNNKITKTVGSPLNKFWVNESSLIQNKYPERPEW